MMGKAMGFRATGPLGMAAAFMLAAALAPPPVRGQSEPGVSTSRIGCFRGRPRPACASFWIVEMQGSVPLAQSARRVQQGTGPFIARDATESVVEWNVGHMVNVGEHYAFGGVLTVGSGNDDVLTGIKARGRRWLSSDVSVELEAGLARSNAGSTRFPGVSGFTSDARLNIRDQGSFYVRWDVLSLPEQRFQGGDYYDPGGTHHGVSVGASAGSIPALIATGALGLTYAVLLAIFIADD